MRPILERAATSLTLGVVLLLAVALPLTGADGARTLEGDYRSGDGDGPRPSPTASGGLARSGRGVI